MVCYIARVVLRSCVTRILARSAYVMLFKHAFSECGVTHFPYCQAFAVAYPLFPPTQKKNAASAAASHTNLLHTLPHKPKPVEKKPWILGLLRYKTMACHVI